MRESLINAITDIDSALSLLYNNSCVDPYPRGCLLQTVCSPEKKELPVISAEPDTEVKSADMCHSTWGFLKRSYFLTKSVLTLFC